MKTVGIIGGLGPDTTAKFYLEIINGCKIKKLSARPPILTWNVPIPRQVEEKLILTQNAKKFLPLLIQAAQKLELAGVDFIVIPCNSVHVFITQIRASVNIPVLSIIEESVRVLEAEHIQNIGLLSTGLTVASQMFQKALKARAINFSVPATSTQRSINHIIHRLVIGGQTKKDEIKLNRIVRDQALNNDSIILLACTDLQLVVQPSPKIKIFDTMQILADTTVDQILNL